MIRGMKRTYCKGGANVCRDFSDGTKICACEKAWSVFFATVTKNWGRGAETKPIPKHVQEAYEREELIEWFLESFEESDAGVPKWIPLAKKVLASKKFNDKIKAYWRSRLEAWCKKNKGNKVCGGL